MESTEENAAYASYQRGDYTSARDSYSTLLTNREDASYLAMRADCHYKLNDYASCLDDVKKVIRLDTDNCATAAVIGGKAATKLENYEDAYHCYKAGLQSQPGHPEIVAELKTLQKIILKDIEKKGSECEEKTYNAVDFCTQEFYPGDDELYLLEVDILAKKYKIQTEDLKQGSNDKKVLEQAANAALSGHKCMMKGQWSEAVHLFTVALNLDPNNHVLRRLRAEVFFMNDDNVNCLRDLWLIPKMNRMADAWKLGGKILWQMELLVLAEFWLRKATKLSHDKDSESKVLFQQVRVSRLYGPLTTSFPVKVDFTEYGRAVFATEDIEAGDVVFCDKPIVFGEVFDTSTKEEHVPFCEQCAASLLTSRDYFKSSFSSFDTGMRNLVEKYWPVSKPIFCASCQYVRYCSEKCRDESWEQYHNVICPGKNKAAKKLFDVCVEKGMEVKNDKKYIIWNGHFSPLILAKIWGSIVSTAKILMKESGAKEPTREHWAKAKSPYRKFIAYGNTSIQRELTDIYSIMKEVFKDCGDGISLDISDTELKGRYFQAVCNLQVFSSPITPYHKFLQALGSGDPTDETFRLLKLLKSKPPTTNVCGMFPLHACLNHSCLNNVEVTDGEIEGKGGVQVVAKRNIKKGEEILTTYIDTSMQRKLRRAWLYKSFNFWCRCTRCEFEGDEPNECTNCKRKSDGQKNFPSCGKCHRAFYCSVACQKSNWSKGHKVVCKTEHSKTSYD